MRPANLKTRIFLDSSDPEETKQAISLLGFLDGQTTNPSLFAKTPEVIELTKQGGKFTKESVYDEYKLVLKEIEAINPTGDISIEVYADGETSAEEMVTQAKGMYGWLNAPHHIKVPSTPEGLKAAKVLTADGIPVNLTLCFTQSQAAAFYSATMGARKEVYISPFQGRFDDIGIEGVDLIGNIIKMYRNGDGHVKVLAASVRDLDHFLYILYQGADIITTRLSVLQAWKDAGMQIPGIDIPVEKFVDKNTYFSALHPNGMKDIPYEELNLSEPIENYNLKADLTDKGIQKFIEDWNNLLQ